jgi:hypothetical protein
VSSISHYTVMVIGDDVEDQLEPYDENRRVAPYRSYWDSEQIRRQQEILTNPKRHDGETYPPDQVAQTDSEGNVTLEELARVYNARYSEDEDEDRVFLDPQAGVYVMSTYNRGWTRVTWCEGYNPSNHGQRSEADQSAGEEILRSLRADETPQRVPASDQESRRKIHVLPELHESKERGADEQDAPTVASDSEVRHQPHGVRLDAESSERSLRDMPETPITETATVSGPFASEWEGARAALREVQHALGSGGGELVFAPCGSQIPHAPHETNRNHIGGAKWDWYSIGGRWLGYFKLKAGAEDFSVGESGSGDNGPENDADQCLKGDVDVEYMRSKRGVAAGALWDRAQVIFGDLPPVRRWEEFYADTLDPDTAQPRSNEAIEEARKLYHDQPRVKAMAEHDSKVGYEERICDFGGASVEDFQVSREQYVQEARDGALPTYAYLYRGEWFAPGKMGWFGMSSDSDAERNRFRREFNEFFDTLPDDTLLTLVDCHI